MNILCINTAFIQADIAVSLNNKKQYKKFDSSCKHSEHVMQGIDNILNGTKIKDLDYMAVCVGTGSFTGIRIGISIAEGFKTANDNLKLIEISSFELAVKNIKNKPYEKYAVVFNALGGRYFVQYFEGEKAVSEPLLLSIECIENVKKYGLADEKLSCCEEYFTIDAKTLLDIAEEKISNNLTVESLQPLYVRQSQAEENLLKAGK